MSKPFEYKVYSFPNTVDRNKMFYNLFQTGHPYDLKSREEWNKTKLGKYIFACKVRKNDYLGNYMYGIVGKEMFFDYNIDLFGDKIGTDTYLVNAAGFAQQVSNHGGGLMGTVLGGVNWVLIRCLGNTGDNEGDSDIINDGIERWYKNYAK